MKIVEFASSMDLDEVALNLKRAKTDFVPYFYKNVSCGMFIQ